MAKRFLEIQSHRLSAPGKVPLTQERQRQPHTQAKGNVGIRRSIDRIRVVVGSTGRIDLGGSESREPTARTPLIEWNVTNEGRVMDERDVSYGRHNGIGERRDRDERIKKGRDEGERQG